MQKASSKAYVSIRKLKKYQEEREKQLQMQHKDPLQMSVIQEQVEESNPDIDAKMADGEERKMHQKEAVAELQAYHSDNSAEGVDSDDLEDDIKDPVLLMA
jgi:hypothetical protein